MFSGAKDFVLETSNFTLLQSLCPFLVLIPARGEDPTLRQNRLALLAALRNLFLEVADISLLQP